MKKFLSFMLCLVMVLTSGVGVVEAKTKTVTAYNSSGVIVGNELDKAPSVSGTTVVKMKDKGEIYFFVKYKAPKAGTYKFKFSSASSTNPNASGLGDCQNFVFYNSKLKAKKLGGLNGHYESKCFYLKTKQGYNYDKGSYHSMEALQDSYDRAEERDTYYPSKTVTLKMKKGEIVYICCDPDTKNSKFTLAISRKG